MSDRFMRDERPATPRDADGELARRARQQMRDAVRNLRAGFDPELVSMPVDPGEDDDEPRFMKDRSDA